MLVLVAVVAALAGTGPARGEDAFMPLKPGTVTAGGAIGRRVDVTVTNNLMVLNVDEDFIRPFQTKTRGGGYIGMGKLIDAAVSAAAYTGDRRVLDFKVRLVDEVVAAQADDGYIGMLNEGERMTGMWDIHEMAYLIYALAMDFSFFGDAEVLEASCKAADYVLLNWGRLPNTWDETTAIASHVSVTGLERAMVTLYRLTDDRRYLDFVLEERSLADWDLDIVVGRRRGIEGHVYAYLCRCLAQLELYRLRPDRRLLRQAGKAIDFMLEGDGMAVTGGCGQWEIWTNDQDGRGYLAETCATAYQVRVLDSLLRLEGKPRYGDVMERVIYNTLFGAQSPDGRQIRYYTPLEGGRVYQDGDAACCPCNYRRIITELPGMIYYTTRDGLAVNLYTSSEATLRVGEVPWKIRQKTDYPSSGHISIAVDPEAPTTCALKLRIPSWCPEATVQVNSEDARTVVGGGFYTITRSWRSGDRVLVDLPMPFRLVRGRQRQAGRAAVLRGPLVFGLDPMQDEWTADRDAVDVGGLWLDPASLGEVATEPAGRPGGIACGVKAWKPGHNLTRPPGLSLRLTEFADPANRVVYFGLRDPAAAIDDELLNAYPPVGPR